MSNMNEDTGQERLAFIGSLVIFASLLGLVLVLLLIEYVLDGSDSKKTFQVFSLEFSIRIISEATFKLFPHVTLFLFANLYSLENLDLFKCKLILHVAKCFY